MSAKRLHPSLAGASPPRARTAQLYCTIAGMEEEPKFKSDDMLVLALVQRGVERGIHA